MSHDSGLVPISEGLARWSETFCKRVLAAHSKGEVDLETAEWAIKLVKESGGDMLRVLT